LNDVRIRKLKGAAHNSRPDPHAWRAICKTRKRAPLWPISGLVSYPGNGLETGSPLIRLEHCKWLCMLLFVLLLASCGHSANKVVGKGDMLPDMKLHDLSNNIVHSRELFKGKVIVFNVWASWCPPCRREMPDLIKLSQILPKDQFMVVGLSVDKNIADVKTFVREHQLPFPVFLDRGGASIAAPKLGIFKYPETLVMNREGKIITRVIGPYQWAGAGTVRALKYIARHGDIPKE